jgi:hypothetical protein
VSSTGSGRPPLGQLRTFDIGLVLGAAMDFPLGGRRGICDLRDTWGFRSVVPHPLIGNHQLSFLCGILL